MKPYWQTNDSRTIRLWHGNSLRVLQGMPDNSVHCVITSPPYWGLKDYKTRSTDEIGTESTLQGYVAKLVNMFSEVRRILRDDGTLWLNLGDGYTDSSGRSLGKNIRAIPWRIALALNEVGWVLRQDIIWYKPDAMPESATDRCGKSHEYIFLLTKSSDYYFDSEAIREPTRNKRSVWTLARSSYKGKHFATFPDELVRTCIKAGTSEKGCCIKCKSPLVRVTKKVGGERTRKASIAERDRSFKHSRNGIDSTLDGELRRTITVGWQKSCKCDTSKVVPCTVLDPFMGSGTTALVALELGRRAHGIELSKEYIDKHQISRIRCRLLNSLATCDLLPE